MVERWTAMAAPAVAFWRLRGALVVLLVWLPLSAGPAIAQGGPTYLTREICCGVALETLFEEIGGNPKVSMIVVEPAIITVVTQASKRHTRPTNGRFPAPTISGSTGGTQSAARLPHRSEGAVPDIEKSFFDLSEINVGGLNTVIARAVAYAKLEDAPAVTSLQIARNVVMLPERSYGPVQRRLGLASGRETAIIYADAHGEITGGDLSGTIRAQRLDLLAQDDWPADQVQAELAAAIGDRPMFMPSSSRIRALASAPSIQTSQNLMETIRGTIPASTRVWSKRRIFSPPGRLVTSSRSA